MAAEGPVMQAERVRSCVVAEQLPRDAVRVQRDWKCCLAFLRAASISNGETTPQACKEAEITVRTLYHWRKKCGGLKMDKATRLKELELALGQTDPAGHAWATILVYSLFVRLWLAICARTEPTGKKRQTWRFVCLR